MTQEAPTPVPSAPTVSVVVPTLNEERSIAGCLAAITAQTYDRVVEVLVIDGGSVDRTCSIAAAVPGVEVLANPDRLQAAAMNLALRAAKGSIIVRIDARTFIEPDYVERCVHALTTTQAALVGGGMNPEGSGWRQRGIARAMRSKLGAGPAAFHQATDARWVDTVYMGAFRTADARSVGGYRLVPTNEDAEFAIRIAERGGVWLDPTIRSVYRPRDTFQSLARQFFRYGRGRATTVRTHPGSLAPRQLFAPLVLLGLLSPWRRPVAVAYAAVVGVAVLDAREDRDALVGLAVALPVMHLSWATGFLGGLVLPYDAGAAPIPMGSNDESGDRDAPGQ